MRCVQIDLDRAATCAREGTSLLPPTYQRKLPRTRPPKPIPPRRSPRALRAHPPRPPLCSSNVLLSLSIARCLHADDSSTLTTDPISPSVLQALQTATTRTRDANEAAPSLRRRILRRGAAGEVRRSLGCEFAALLNELCRC